MKRYGVTAKIWISVGVVVAGYALSTLVGQLQSGDLERRMDRVSVSLFPAAQKTQAAEAGFERMTKLYRDAVMMEDGAPLEQALAESTQVAEALRAVAALPNFDTALAGNATRMSAEVRSIAGDSDRAYRAMIASKGNPDEATQGSLRSLAGRNDKLRKDLAAAVSGASGLLRSDLEQARRNSARQRWIALAVFLLTLGASSLLVNLTIQRSIRRPLSGLTAQLAESASHVSLAAGRLSEMSRTLSRSSSGQAAELQETSASSEEVNAMAGRNAGSAAEAQELMQKAGTNYVEVDRAHEQLVSAMHEIGQSSAQISKIIKVIDEIAFQTNILALNAAVEAARAGEAGAGFSVVASEVRSLAQRSAQAAQDTSALIEESVTRSGAGRERLEAVSRLLEVNREIAGKVDRLIGEISTASREQARGMEQISATVARTSQATQMTVGHAEASASAVGELLSESEALTGVVESLEAMIGR